MFRNSGYADGSILEHLTILKDADGTATIDAWHVKYDTGKEEDLDEQEVRSAIANFEQNAEVTDADRRFAST